jgi:hypothetical protein
VLTKAPHREAESAAALEGWEKAKNSGDRPQLPLFVGVGPHNHCVRRICYLPNMKSRELPATPRLGCGHPRPPLSRACCGVVSNACCHVPLPRPHLEEATNKDGFSSAASGRDGDSARCV